ncbi:hypothetical protein N9174_01160 [bacterium]|nr:hypothetical protein [bacterium]
MSLIVYNPTSGPAAGKTVMAQRAETLQNGVLGVIDNGKPNSDTVLNRIVKGIQSLYPINKVISIKKESVSHAVADDAAQKLAGECDFVVAGIGD